jgi:hypothetical protein
MIKTMQERNKNEFLGIVLRASLPPAKHIDRGTEGQ